MPIREFVERSQTPVAAKRPTPPGFPQPSNHRTLQPQPDPISELAPRPLTAEPGYRSFSDIAGIEPGTPLAPDPVDEPGYEILNIDEIPAGGESEDGEMDGEFTVVREDVALMNNGSQGWSLWP
ncbi:hypothetical protein K458DRAFT_401005 [Lentithecium fluviatile CBS 122367]|uniref:Uncharacterized protein n=1 Tax=Lentithecium fluviatile CBS 122367 TaxID=1168545 RepID=A0A6G1JEJ5_9PLEO|nr:hypothetical protein K458DRAFT_401005 [Lentithecium fluviatile CBS 122367]